MLRIKTLAMVVAATAIACFFAIGFQTAKPAFASNTYPYGQCTYYAKSVRSDIGNYWGDAHNWAAAARRNGFSVTSRPRIGDVAVFQPYVQGRSPYGHVAIVAAVNGNRFKTISMWGNEANGRIHVNWHIVGRGVSFIHKKAK